MSFVAGGDLSGGIKYAVGEMSDTRSCRLTVNTGRGRRTDIIKPGYPGTRVWRPSNPQTRGLKKPPGLHSLLRHCQFQVGLLNLIMGTSLYSGRFGAPVRPTNHKIPREYRGIAVDVIRV